MNLGGNKTFMVGVSVFWDVRGLETVSNKMHLLLSHELLNIETWSYYDNIIQFNFLKPFLEK